ncbi:hypothetical protein BDC45DRAFT_576159 [Circinella umbellata]|nr:hypothetical protein BDC45DRAFT_576159 [Circinella umbellata]
MIRTEDENSDSDLEYNENFSYGQDSIISDELKSNATDNSNSSNDNNSNDDDDHTSLKFVIFPPRKFLNIEEKSIEFYSLMFSKGVPRKTYRVILSFFNDWIPDEHFVRLPMSSPEVSEKLLFSCMLLATLLGRPHSREILRYDPNNDNCTSDISTTSSGTNEGSDMYCINHELDILLERTSDGTDVDSFTVDNDK